MRDFKNKVAVVTGAASGIGRALAEHCACEGAHVVLADIDAHALHEAEHALAELGGEVLAVPTNVSDSASVERLANAAYARFGAVHLLFNNAGVGAWTTLWETTLADWDWLMGINLNGVFYGIHAFVPRMLAQGDECHIVNTASVAGLITGPQLGAYKASKHAIVALSETLCCELAERSAKVRVSVLCPGFVKTRLMTSRRNDSLALHNQDTDSTSDAMWQGLRQAVESGMAPAEVAGYVFDAIRDERFYILTHPDYKPVIEQRMLNILQGRSPA